MHALQMAQIAPALIAFGRAIAAPPARVRGDAAAQADQKAASSSLNGEAAHAYWLAQRFRCDAWHQAISDHRERVEHCGTSRRMQSWLNLTPTLQEILLSEPLTRMIAYLARLAEQTDRDNDWGALAHSALSNHLEARQRCLNLIVFGTGLPVEQAVRLNRLRRKLEHFSDELLSLLPVVDNVDEYAFDLSFVRTQQVELARFSGSSRIGALYQQLLATSIERLVQPEIDHRIANSNLNHQLIDASLGMFPPICFDGLGLPLGPKLLAHLHSISDGEVNLYDLSRPISTPFQWLSHTHRNHKSSQRYDRN